ncbi:MAG: hypothetical protein RL172_1145 [Bacteroidota bacterium]|jgi:hypothetical protein
MRSRQYGMGVLKLFMPINKQEMKIVVAPDDIGFSTSGITMATSFIHTQPC